MNPTCGEAEKAFPLRGRAGLGWLPMHISMQSERTGKRVLTERVIPVAPLRPTGTSEVIIDDSVIHSKYFYLIFVEEVSSFFIVGLAFFCIMLAAIQFNGKAGFRAVEITDKAAYDLLPVKFDIIVKEKIVPQVSFLLCHFLAKLSGNREKIFTGRGEGAFHGRLLSLGT